VGLAAGGRRHRDAALAVVVDHALVVVPEHVPARAGADASLWQESAR
jgi:hypothetical protein